MKQPLLISAFCCLSLMLNGQVMSRDSITEPLYLGVIPNNTRLMDEIVEHRETGGRFVANTSVPTITAYRAANPKGKAIIICPGGGYRGLAIDKEGFLVARQLQEAGYHAFVLKYRTPKAGYYEDQAMAPLQDAEQALNRVKNYLNTWGVSEEIKIGIMGFSAGGHLAAMASNQYAFDFSILVYPVITMEQPYTHQGSRENLLGQEPTATAIQQFSADQLVGPHTPPVLLVHASDDRGVPVQNSLRYYQACLKYKIPAGLHLYPKGGHGFGMYNATTPDLWLERAFHWLESF